MNTFQNNLTENAAKALLYKVLKVVVPTVLGALGGLTATMLPQYFNAFCGV